ncbi:MAG: SO_0444 family Cu/Zn efflux transporter [bacterium]
MLDKLLDILIGFWNVLGEMSPYLLLGFLFAGILFVYIPAKFIEKHLGGRGLLPVIKASALGVPIPLCSCGVIPVAASLRRSGASRGSTTSFLISTPETGVDSILVTFSLLGIVFAIFRPLMAFISGVLGGWIVDRFLQKEEECPHEKVDTQTEPLIDLSDCGCSDDSCCTSDDSKSDSKFKKAIKYGFIELPADIGRALLIGLLISGLISAIVPENYFANYLGHGILAMLVMMAVGIPVYVCATASTPVAAAIIAAGVSPGAALVFLMTGPATNAATIAVIWRTMGHKTTYIYLATVAITALLSGLLLDEIFIQTGTSATPAMPYMFPIWFKTACSIVLLGILAYSQLSTRFSKQQLDVQETKETASIQVAGMNCSHCQNVVTRALLESAGVENASVDLASGKAMVSGNGFNLENLKNAIRELGYTITGD